MTTTHACYVTVDNSRNTNALVLSAVQIEHGSFTPTLEPNVTTVAAGGTLSVLLQATEIGYGAEATLVWTTGATPDQATITMDFQDPITGDNLSTLGVTGSAAAMMTYGVSYLYASSGDTTGNAPMVRDTVPTGGNPVRIVYSIVPNQLWTQPSTWSLQGIDRVVMLMLENRGLDHLLGQIYTENSAPSIVIPEGSASLYNGLGATPTFSNSYESTPVTASPVPASGSYDTPNPDPGETWEHVNVQLYSTSNPPSTPPGMGGFLLDYVSQAGTLASAKQIMQFYTPADLPVISALAQKYAVSDAWFSSVPTQTNTNRAFSISGTSSGLVDNENFTPFYTNTLFNVLSNCGFQDWALYVQDEWPPVLDSSPCYTTYQFEALGQLVAGGSQQRVCSLSDFLSAAQAGTLPAFSYLEPAWYEAILGNGNDYHPPGNLAPGETFLSQVYAALTSNAAAWQNTLLIVTFDEHGGTLDHAPPGPTIAPDGMSASPQNFGFNRLGVRVPMILISPHVAAGTVFRSPTSVPYDHTSLLKTLLGWQGIDVSGGVVGARAVNAPDFSGVVSSTVVQTDAVTAPEPRRVEARPDKTRPLNDRQRALCPFWAYNLSGASRGSDEHRRVAAEMAACETLGDLEAYVERAAAKLARKRGHAAETR